MNSFLKFVFLVLVTFSSVPFIVPMDQHDDAAEDVLIGKKRQASGENEEKAPAFKWLRTLFSRSSAGAGSPAEEMFQLRIGECSVEIPASKVVTAGTIKKFLEDKELFVKRFATLLYLQNNIDSIAAQLNQTLKTCLKDLANGCISKGLFSPGGVYVYWETDPWGEEEKNHFFNFLKPSIEALLGICEHCPDPVFAMEFLQMNSRPFVSAREATHCHYTFFSDITRRAFGEAMLCRGGWLAKKALCIDGFGRPINLERFGLKSRLERIFSPLGLGAFVGNGQHPFFAYLDYLLLFFTADEIARIKSIRPGDCLASFIKQLNRYSFMSVLSAAREAFQLGDSDTFDSVAFFRNHFASNGMELTDFFDGLGLVDNQRLLNSLRMMLLNDCSSDVVIREAALLGISNDLIKGLLRAAVCLDIPSLTDALRPLVLRHVNAGGWRDVLDDYYRYAGVSLLTPIDEKLANEAASRSFGVSDWSRNGAIMSRIRLFFDNGFGVNLAILPEHAELDLSHLYLSDLNGISSLLATLKCLSKTAKSLNGFDCVRGRFELNLSANKLATCDAVGALSSSVVCGAVKKVNLSENLLWQSGLPSVFLTETFGPMLALGGVVLCDQDFVSVDDFWYCDSTTKQLKKRAVVVEERCSICFDDLKEDTNIVRFPCGHYLCEECVNKLVGDAVTKDKDPTCPMCRASFKSSDSKLFTYGEYKKRCLAVAVGSGDIAQ